MKLTYFDSRGRAEPIRFLLAAAGVDFIDNRISHQDWANLKQDTPWGNLPILETDDGVVLAESIAICRYIARKYNLMGSNDMEAAKCDEYVDAFVELIIEWANYAFLELDQNKKAEKKTKFVEISAPNFFKKLNSILENNGGTYLVGRGLSWADILIACNLETLALHDDPIMISAYPAVMAMRDAVMSNSNIKSWIDKRTTQ